METHYLKQLEAVIVEKRDVQVNQKIQQLDQGIWPLLAPLGPESTITLQAHSFTLQQIVNALETAVSNNLKAKLEIDMFDKLMSALGGAEGLSLAAGTSATISAPATTELPITVLETSLEEPMQETHPHEPPREVVEDYREAPEYEAQVQPKEKPADPLAEHFPSYTPVFEEEPSYRPPMEESPEQEEEPLSPAIEEQAEIEVPETNEEIAAEAPESPNSGEESLEDILAEIAATRERIFKNGPIIQPKPQEEAPQAPPQVPPSYQNGRTNPPEGKEDPFRGQHDPKGPDTIGNALKNQIHPDHAGRNPRGESEPFRFPGE